jgi:hypothetical protein
MWALFASTVVLGVLALRGIRWAYVLYIVVGLLYFPLRVGFELSPWPCQSEIDLPLALYSLTNYAHIVLFALFFVMTRVQLPMRNGPAFAVAGVATLLMGVLVEAAQSMTGNGNCRARDLVPDAAGALVGMTILLLWQTARSRRAVAAQRGIRHPVS